MATPSPMYSWPPTLSSEQQAELTRLATTWSLCHGALYLPVATFAEGHPSAPPSAIHAPLTLFPTPFPRKLFEHAQWLQSAYNVLYARIAMDDEFLDQAMGMEGVGGVDGFVASLWQGWKLLREEGIAQPLQLGLFRSDYLMHQPSLEAEMSLKQVEFNTISSSFGPLADRVASLHRYLAQATSYYDSSPILTQNNFPANDALLSLAEGLAEAHRAYGKKDARILFVVQAGERNVFDQRWLEYELLEKHTARVVRLTFDEVSSQSTLAHDRTLAVKRPQDPLASEISVIYFRAGYTPNDYPTRRQYEARFLLERSTAIKCPTINLQLAGSKKVQQILTEPGVLESFLCNPDRWGASLPMTQLVLERIRANWMGMWSLDADDGGGAARARELSANLVLKPQREGGGNNVYKASIPAFLDSLPKSELKAWIAMEMIQPPVNVQNLLVRAGSGVVEEKEIVSELGIFGWALFGARGQPVKEKNAGWLVRTKGVDSDEGGVAVGFSVLDSVVLTD